MNAPVSRTIVGHEAQRSFLARQLRSGRCSATTMLAGPAGIGKRLVAAEIAATILCEKNNGDSAPYGGCKECKSCKLFSLGNHPDAHIFDCGDAETTSVEELRSLLYTLHLNPFAGSARVIIFENAELLSIQASNLLLKVLEEPRPRTYFILTSANPSRLPATLLSRCQIWFFESLSPDQIMEAIQSNNLIEKFEELSPEQKEHLNALCDGSLESLHLVKDQFEEWQKTQTILERIFRGDALEASLYAATLAKSKERLKEHFRLLRIWGRNKLRETTRRGSDRFSLASHRLAIFVENVLEAARLITERNVGALVVLTLLFSDLSDTGEFTRSLHNDRLLRKLAI